MSEVMTTIEEVRLENYLEGNEHNQYLTFSVPEERFAVGIMDVREIIEVESLARVPMTPDYISGVINLRGNVVPVVDLAARLDKERSTISERSCIVMVELVIEERSQVLGMLVDSVNEIMEIQEGDIQAPPNFGTDVRTEFIKYMGWVGDSFVILLNVDHVLSIADLASLDQVRQMHEKHQHQEERSLDTQQQQETVAEASIKPEEPSASESAE